MKLLFVCKRRPQQRDLLERPYGRFHFLPAGLAARGHQVRVLLIGHDGGESEHRKLAGVEWITLDARRMGPFGVMQAARREAGSFLPEWVIGCSDTWCGALANRLATLSRARLAIDAYDNYEAYMPWNLPLHWAWRRAVHAAGLVTAAGPELAGLLDTHRPDESRTRVLPMAADPGFVPMDKLQARAQLGLDPHCPAVGYYGGWASNRGTRMLAEAFRRVRAQTPECRLVLTGKPPADLLAEPGVMALGYVADAMLPVLVNAIDVACVITTNSSFGRYSYPAKLCEARACGTAVAATATSPVRWMLHDDSRFLCAVDDPRAFADRVQSLLHLGRVDYGQLPGWSGAVDHLDQWLVEGNDRK